MNGEREGEGINGRWVGKGRIDRLKKERLFYEINTWS